MNAPYVNENAVRKYDLKNGRPQPAKTCRKQYARTNVKQFAQTTKYRTTPSSFRLTDGCKGESDYGNVGSGYCVCWLHNAGTHLWFCRLGLEQSFQANLEGTPETPRPVRIDRKNSLDRAAVDCPPLSEVSQLLERYTQARYPVISNVGMALLAEPGCSGLGSQGLLGGRPLNSVVVSKTCFGGSFYFSYLQPVKKLLCSAFFWADCRALEASSELPREFICRKSIASEIQTCRVGPVCRP
jgi:hypothetical protein